MARKATRKRDQAKNSGVAVGCEAQLWQMADALRGGMDAAEYKHVVLGLLFLKYISDTFEEQHARLEIEREQGADPEDPDEYRAVNVSDWSGERLCEDKGWKYGVPPAGNANFAWVQHIVHHLAPAGVAGLVLANGSMSSNQLKELSYGH